ncbi:MAG TPA: anti-sigma factor, partial [Lapillicoccus sp.]
MTHVSDDVLAAIALGDPDVDPADHEHVSACPVCSEEVTELVQVHSLLREEVGMRSAHRVEPGPQVWERVLAATDEDAAPEPRPTAEPFEESVSSVSSMADRRAARTGPGRNRRSWWLAGTAAACLLVGVLVGRAMWAPGETAQPVVASIPLTTLDATKQKEGTAELLGNRGSQGQELRVDTQPMSSGSGYVEVWLINTDGKRMVSLGVLPGTEATFS